MSTSYPSDLTEAQYKKIETILEGVRKHTHPRTYDLRDIFNGVMYVVKSGCQWRMVPKEYPKWRTLHTYFRKWSEVPRGHSESALAQCLKKIGRMRAYETWQKTLDEHGYSRRSKCEEYGHRTP
jgi:transposase